MLDLLAYVIGELLLIGAFYWPGWLLLRLLTLGRYPPTHQQHNRQFVAMIGLVVLIATLGFVYS